MSTIQSLPNLPASAVHQTLPALTARLPLPVIDAPEERAARDEVIIAAVAALGPANALEAMLAAQVIAAHVHAMDCLRGAVQPNQPPEDVRCCRAQAIAMLRQMQSALRTLQRMQAAHRKPDAAVQPCVRAPDDAPGSPDITVEGEQFALHHRKRASLIRSLGRLPDRLDFGPLSPDLIAAIVIGTSPILRALEGRAPAKMSVRQPDLPLAGRRFDRLGLRLRGAPWIIGAFHHPLLILINWTDDAASLMHNSL